ncbi:MAG: hypothetical protein JWN24_1088 [Phycisphaerales bacterium]|nr:hypothetical protein [Phycisphaerales bacterium]
MAPTQHLSSAVQTSRGWRLLALIVLALSTAVGCDKKSVAPASSSSSTDAAAVADANTVEILFSYGSEKQKWIDNVTADFNAGGRKLPSGKTVRVKAVAAGSGESMEDLLAGHTQADVWSPASAVFVKLANARSQAKGGPLVGPTQELVLSPVVIAMWKPMAEALGWPSKPVGWSDVIALAKDPRGWAAYGHPEFGTFRFGHTHPEFSNSGLISVIAETYAGAGKVKDLNGDDLRDPKVAQYLEDVERSVVHYGRSTGFFGRRLFEDGPQYLSAAVLYENMVVESYDHNLSVPLVAIYPKEGTIWSDHPVGIVQRDWVTPEHKQAAQLYIDFLRAAPQQQKALRYGFRPAEGEMGVPIDMAHGVDPKQPGTILELPSADTVNSVIELWRKHKKHSTVVLVFDKSGSMQDEDKIGQAKRGALELAGMLRDQDAMGLVPFSSDVVIVPPALMATGRSDVTARIGALFPDGETRLYEAVLAAHKLVTASQQPDRISAVVVLTDGEDNGKRVTLPQLLDALGTGREGAGVRIFTIGYGNSARLDDLKKISGQTRGEFYAGKPENIRSIFQDIATFF